MSYTPDTTPFFMFTNNQSFSVTKNAYSYLPSNLNAVYKSQTEYNTSTKTLSGSNFFCNFDFLGTVINQDDTAMYNSLERTDVDPSVSIFGRNTSVYKGIGARLDDMITYNGSSIKPNFYRGSYASNSTLQIQQYKTFISGVIMS